MTPKVSILVPVYKASKYIERCARSLFEQTFQDIEYIFVDDASPDNSIAILKNVLSEYPIRQKQVKILVNQKNEGVGVSRNIAIDNSTGEYISFIDSDDYIEPNTIEELYTFSILENVDIVVFNMEIQYHDHSEIISDSISADKDENLINVLTEKRSHNLCNKFVKSNLYKMKECRIPAGLNYQEDFYVYVRLVYFAEIIRKLDKVFYYYDFRNSESLTKKMEKMHFENTVILWNSFDEFLTEKKLFEKYKLYLDYTKIHRKIRLMIDTNDFKLRKNYSDIFFDEEKRCEHLFSRGERLFLWFLRHRLFITFYIFQKAIIFKNWITKNV